MGKPQGQKRFKVVLCVPKAQFVKKQPHKIRIVTKVTHGETTERKRENETMHWTANGDFQHTTTSCYPERKLYLTKKEKWGLFRLEQLTISSSWVCNWWCPKPNRDRVIHRVLSTCNLPALAVAPFHNTHGEIKLQRLIKPTQTEEPVEHRRDWKFGTQSCYLGVSPLWGRLAHLVGVQ